MRPKKEFVTVNSHIRKTGRLQINNVASQGLTKTIVCTRIQIINIEQKLMKLIQNTISKTKTWFIERLSKVEKLLKKILPKQGKKDPNVSN